MDMKSYNSNNLLLLGIGILLIGIVLFVYLKSATREMAVLYNKIDFEELDKNNMMSTSEKYYQYLSYADFLNKKIKQNSKLPIKNYSCNYLDYAYHNSVSMYKLIFEGIGDEVTRKGIVESNIKDFYSNLSSYKTCPKSYSYKKNLDLILEKIEKSSDISAQQDIRIAEFLRDKRNIEQIPDEEKYSDTKNIEPASNFNKTSEQQIEEQIPTPDLKN